MDDPRWPDRFEYTKQVDAAKLFDELEPVLPAEPDELGNLQAGFRLEVTDDTTIVWAREGADQAAVDAVVAAHDPTPPPPPPPRTGVKLLDDLRRTLASWPPATAADRDVLLRRLTRAVVAIGDILQDRDA